MLILKYIILFLIFLISTKIGILIAKKYKDRVEILHEFKTLLNNLKSNIKFTYKPLPQIFMEISESTGKVNKKSSKIFEKACTYMENETAEEAWKRAIDESKILKNEDDKKILKNMGNLLRQN